MKLRYSELENGICLIKLIGSLDLTGTYSIEIEFVRLCEGNAVGVLVDLSEVDYISSIGVHMLVNASHAIANRGGKMGLLGPQRNVLDVLELTGISQIIPIYPDLESSQAGLFAE